MRSPQRRGLEFLKGPALLLALVLLTGFNPQFQSRLVDTVHAAEEEISASELGWIRPSKGVGRVLPDGWAQVRLVLRNNGTVPVTEIEVQEYYPLDFILGQNVTVRYRGREFPQPLLAPPPSPTGAQAQFIVVFPYPAELLAKEEAMMEYWIKAPRPGDFVIPTSLTWYSFTYRGSLARTSIYSNGLAVHIPNEYEIRFYQLFPYLTALATFTVTLVTLMELRRRLRAKPFGR